MGDQRTQTGLTGDLVLDAGALIAFEKGDKELTALIRGALTLAHRIAIPATVLAQVWRGGSRAALLAQLIGSIQVDPLEEKRAKEIGLRLGERDASDVADAHVVCCATEFRAAIATSDPEDIQALVTPGDQLTLIAV